MQWLDLHGRSAAARSQQFAVSGARPAAAGRVTPVGGDQSDRARFEPGAPFEAISIAGNDCLEIGRRINAAGRLALQPKRRDANCASKRLFDFVLALIGILLFLPLFVVVAVAVRLETPGPVLFRQ